MRGRSRSQEAGRAIDKPWTHMAKIRGRVIPMSQMLLRRNRGFRYLFSASAISNLGDGVSALAFPWLATLLTRDPFLIAVVAAATRLPWLLISIPAGVVIDRMDRRAVMVRADLFRMVLTVGVVGLILLVPDLPLEGDPIVYIAALSALAFLLGVAEVLRDNAAQTCLPSVVDKDDLESANGQIWSVEQVMGSLVGPPIAGVLIALAAPAPFILDAVTFGLAAWLIWMIAIPARVAPSRERRFWFEFMEGAKWLWRNVLLFRLAILLGFVNGTATAYLTSAVTLPT